MQRVITAPRGQELAVYRPLRKKVLVARSSVGVRATRRITSRDRTAQDEPRAALVTQASQSTVLAQNATECAGVRGSRSNTAPQGPSDNGAQGGAAKGRQPWLPSSD